MNRRSQLIRVFGRQGEAGLGPVAEGGSERVTSRGYPCPCCGYLAFEEPPGSYDICSICYWEDDVIQLRDPLHAGGANRHSLVESQRNYEAFGACEERLRPYVRQPTEHDIRDAGWRVIDLELDDLERALPGGGWERPWPGDPTLLYWWQPTFWRKGSVSP